MIRRLKKTAALLCCISMLALCSCAWLGDLLYDASENEEPEPAPTEAAPSETAGSELSGGENPVFAFFISFLRIYNKQSAGLFDAVSSSGDDIEGEYMALMHDMARLTEVYASLGMLPYSSETVEPYYGSISGAYAGEGAIDRTGGFRFTFANGDTLSGRVDETSSLTAEKRSGSTVSELRLVRSGRGYTARIDFEGTTSFLELSRSGLRYTRFSNASADEPKGELFFPESSAGRVFAYSSGQASLSE